MTPTLDVPGYYRRLREVAASTTISLTRRDTAETTALGVHTGDVGALLATARESLAAGDTARGLNAVQRTLVLDVVNGDAYELLLEMSRIRELAPGPTARRVLEGLRSLSTSSPAIRGMLDLGLLMEDLPFARNALACPDPVSADAVRLQRTPAGASTEAVLEELRSRRSLEDYWQAAIIGAAWSRKLDVLAAATASADPEWVPRVSLRRALRVAFADADHDLASALLELYLRDHPEDEDGPAFRAQLEEIPQSDLEIARHGFPLTPKGTRDAATDSASQISALYALHYSHPDHTSGYTARSQALVTGLQEHDIRVTAVTRLGYPTDLDPDHWPAGSVPRSETVGAVTYERLLQEDPQLDQSPIAPYVQRYADHLVEHARAAGAQILHGASNHLNGFAVAEAARRLGIPSIYEVRGLREVTRASREPLWGEGSAFLRLSALETQAAAGVDHVITINERLADELVRRGVDRDRITVVHNGVDTTQFTPSDADSEAKGTIPTIGYIGSLISYEGLDTLLAAAARLRRSRTRFRILIVGDGTARYGLEARAKELGVQDLVEFRGRVPHEEVADLYREMDVLVYPRLPLPVCRMVAPLKPLEAMAMGTCVVVSDVEALTEIVEENRTGLVHKTGDSASLAKVLRRALRRPSLRTKLGARAAQEARSEHDWSNRADQLVDIYQQLVNG